jgi:hypothetical protein
VKKEREKSRGQQEVLLFVGGDLCFHLDRFSFNLSGEPEADTNTEPNNRVAYALNHMT